MKSEVFFFLTFYLIKKVKNSGDILGSKGVFHIKNITELMVNKSLNYEITELTPGKKLKLKYYFRFKK